MTIRNANDNDINGIIELLRQVRNVHADLRPDIFTRDDTKYNTSELLHKLHSENNPIYVAVDDDGKVVGHVFCEVKSKDGKESFFIDDFCVDENARGQHIGGKLFEYVKTEAKSRDYHEITLNVWVGNNDAMTFYLAMGMRPRKTLMEYML